MQSAQIKILRVRSVSNDSAGVVGGANTPSLCRPLDAPTRRFRYFNVAQTGGSWSEGSQGTSVGLGFLCSGGEACASRDNS